MRGAECRNRARRDGRTDALAAAADFGVSPDTIRGDSALENQGYRHDRAAAGHLARPRRVDALPRAREDSSAHTWSSPHPPQNHALTGSSAAPPRNRGR